MSNEKPDYIYFVIKLSILLKPLLIAKSLEEKKKMLHALYK